MAKEPQPVPMGTPVHIQNLKPVQEQALRILSMPVLSKIAALEMLGYLPAIPSLPGVGAGANVFSETRFLLEQKDHMDGEQAIYPQLAVYLLEANLVTRTREEYDHHVTLTPWGRQVVLTASWKF